MSDGATTGNQKCPVIKQCRCYDRTGRGIKIVCRGLKTVSFQDLPQDVVTDMYVSVLCSINFSPSCIIQILFYNVTFYGIVYC